MIRRIPLWATLLPLLIGIAVYHHWWSGQRDAFAAEVRALLGPGATIEIGGFPYRLEADVGRIAITRANAEARLAVGADGLALNRQPNRQDLTVAHALRPSVAVDVPSVSGGSLTVEAAASQTSLRLEDRHIARLSSVFDDAVIRTRLLSGASTAKSFEVHFRETPQVADPASRAPTGPEQAQLVVEGQGVRYAGGDPLTLVAELGVTARGAIRRLADWLPGGTAELKRLELRDARGVIATMAATASPDAAGRLLIAGTVETICPEGLAALFDGRPAPTEKRARRMVRFTFNGPVGGLVLTRAAGEPIRAPVRNQEPPCPVLRR